MKEMLIIWAMALFVISCESGNNADGNDSTLIGSSTLSNSLDSMSYAIGGMYSKQFKNQGVVVPTSEMVRGLKEGIDGTPDMNVSTIQSFVMSYRREVSKRQRAPFTKEDPLTTNLDSLSYAMGAELGGQLHDYNMAFNPATFMQGAVDAYEEGAYQFNDTQDQVMLRKYTGEMQAKRNAKRAEKAAANIEMGKQFIADKAKEAGVKSTPSGLHYKVLKEGNGPSPKVTDRVKVHYHGTLIDGTVFDSSVDKGAPIEFALTGVIKGWTEGLQLMNLNSKFQFYIPADLAYGMRGSGALIGPGATLVFDVELLEIK